MPLIQKAWENIVKNSVVTIPSVIIISIVLFLFNSLLGVQQKTDETLNRLQQKFSITFFLKNDVDSFTITKLISELESRADVIAPVKFTSQDEARAFIEKAFSINPDTISTSELSLPPSITVTPRSPSDVERIESFVKNLGKNILNEASMSQETQKNITNQMSIFLKEIEDTTQRAVLFFIFVFIITGFLLIGSSISITMSSHSKEISIMKLVGAHFGTITNPYIVEGVMLGFFAFIISVIATLLFGTVIIGDRIALNALLFELIGVIGISALASYLTSYFYLKR